jgi:hypothetical protein
MLWCGRSPSGEDLFLCLADKAFLSQPRVDDEPGADSRLQTIHYHMLLHFMCAMLQLNPDRSVVLMTKYPSNPTLIDKKRSGM